MQVCKGAYIPYFKINGPILLLSLFQRISQPSRLDQQNSKRKYCRLPPSSFRINVKVHPLILLWTPKGFIFQEYFMSFFLNLYIPRRLRKSFKFMVLRLPENTFMSQNLFILNLFIFNHVFKQNSPPGSYHHIPG